MMPVLGLTCPVCNADFKTPSGVISHARAKHVLDLLETQVAARQAWHYMTSPQSYSESERQYVYDCLTVVTQGLAPATARVG